MKNRFFSLLSLILIVVLLTGCVEMKMHVTVNKDGSGMYRFTFLVAEEAAGQMKEMKEDIEKDNYRIKEVKEDGKVGFIATRQSDHILSDPPEFMFSNQSNDNNKNNDIEKYVTMDSGLYSTRVQVDMPIDMSEMGTSEEKRMLSMIGNQMDMEFSVTLPVEPEQHNATSVSEDGKTLTWELKPGDKNQIQALVHVPHVLSWVVTGLIVLLLLGGVSFIVTRRRKASSSDQLNQ